MNGVVFQTSAMMITKNDPDLVVSRGFSMPKVSLTKPVAGSKASRQANAATTVTAPYGTSTDARIAVRAKIARYIAWAMSIPSTSSSATEQTVMIIVLPTAVHHVLEVRTASKLLRPTNSEASGKRRSERRSDSQNA